MHKTKLQDARPILPIAIATWRREAAVGRRRLLSTASAMGYRLVVCTLEGDDWSPTDDPASW